MRSRPCSCAAAPEPCCCWPICRGIRAPHRVPPGFAPTSLRVLDQATALRAGAEWAAFRAERHDAAGMSSVGLGAFATARLDGEITGAL